MKTMGILGGVGPQATMDFERRVHHAAQRLIPQHGNRGYPPMVVYYHRRPPFVMRDDRTPMLPLEPDPDLLRAAQWLGTRADFLVITANGPHALQAQIEHATGCHVLSMIAVTLQDVQRRGWQKVGVLGFGDPIVSIYTRPMRQFALTYEEIESALRVKLDEAIWALIEGRASAQATACAREAIVALRAKQVDGIILGCTEIPLLLGQDAEAPDLVNPAEVLAESAVRHALT